MAAISIKGKINQDTGQFTRTDLPLGTETITATVGASEIAIVIDTGVALDGAPLEAITKQLIETLREAEFSMT